MKTNTNEIVWAKVSCKKCGAEIGELEVFPGKICIRCHEVKFEAMVRRNGGILPKPNFLAAISK